MSQGDNVVINPLERALSEDINNLQSVERSRRLADLAAANRSVPQTWSPAGGNSGSGSIYVDVPGTSVSGVRNGVLAGLAVAWPVLAGSTSLTIQPGALAYFDQSAGPDANYDPNAYQIGRLQEPLTGVTPGVTYGGTPIPGAGTFQWLLCARIVNTTTITAPREVFDPGTGTFNTVNVPKLTEGQIEFLFIDADGATIAHPGDEYQPLALVASDSGAFAFPVQDIRQLLTADSREGFDGQVDLDSVNYSLGSSQAHSLSYVLNGRRRYMGSPSLTAANYLDPNDGPIAANETYSMWTFECRRPDGSFWRPPNISSNAVGSANIVLSSLSPISMSNSAALSLPAPYDIWQDWILGYGGGNQVQPYNASQLGAYVTRVGSSTAQRVIHSGRRVINTECNKWVDTVPFTANTRFGSVESLTVAAGYVDDHNVSLPTYNFMTYGKDAKAIKYRVTMNAVTNMTLDATISSPVLWLKTSTADPSAANTHQVFPLEQATQTDTLNLAEMVVFEFWWPVTELSNMYVDIRNGEGSARLFDAVFDGADIDLYFDVLEWQI